MRLVEEAPAKLNLFLGVQPCIVDGKHPLTSVFTTISLHDVLTFDFMEGGSLSLDAVTLETDSSTLDIPPDENIVMRAVQAFDEAFGLARIPALQLHISLEKRIPVQAGLGGGSSDAAATLKVLARISDIVSGIDPTTPELLEVARRLGADVPFFLYGACVHMGGFGDEFIERLALPVLDLVLVKPTRGISTAEVYRVFDEQAHETPSSDSFIAELQKGASVQALCEAMANNLESAAINLLSEIAVIKQRLESSGGVIRAMLAGSGSTVFCICENSKAAEQIAADMLNEGYWAIATTTLA